MNPNHFFDMCDPLNVFKCDVKDSQHRFTPKLRSSLLYLGGNVILLLPTGFSKQPTSTPTPAHLHCISWFERNGELSCLVIHAWLFQNNAKQRGLWSTCVGEYTMNHYILQRINTYYLYPYLVIRNLWCESEVLDRDGDLNLSFLFVYVILPGYLASEKNSVSCMQLLSWP